MHTSKTTIANAQDASLRIKDPVNINQWDPSLQYSTESDTDSIDTPMLIDNISYLATMQVLHF